MICVIHVLIESDGMPISSNFDNICRNMAMKTRKKYYLSYILLYHAPILASSLVFRGNGSGELLAEKATKGLIERWFDLTGVSFRERPIVLSIRGSSPTWYLAGLRNQVQPEIWPVCEITCSDRRFNDLTSKIS
jgi:hypothetical protein